MKKYISFIILAFAACALSVSCNVMDDDRFPTDEVVFGVRDFDVKVQTKATAIGAANFGNTFYASATTGAAGSETSAWNSVTFTGPTNYAGGKMWPDSNPSYHFYGSNVAITHNAAGCTVAATNATDVMCAYMASPTYKVKNTLNFIHVFARVGSVTVNAESGYTLSNVTVVLKNTLTGGTYNIRTAAWSGTTNAGNSTIYTKSGTNAHGTISNDLYVIPGTYTVEATWTATKGEYSQTFSSKSTTVEIERGKVNNLDTTLGGNATEIIFGVSVEEWTTTSKTLTFPTS